MNDDVMLKMPLSYNPITAEELRSALTTNVYRTEDYLCSNPWSVIGSDDDVEAGVSIKGETLSEIIKRAVEEAIKGENTPTAPKIEKYHIKHK